jgi:hypothetical protein
MTSSNNSVKNQELSDELDDSTKLAVQRLSELLKHPDDLNVKIDFLRRRFQQEKSSVETQLRSDIQSQFDDIQETFRLFEISKSGLSDLKDHLAKVESLCLENQTKIPGYDTIKKVTLLLFFSIFTNFFILGIASA